MNPECGRRFLSHPASDEPLTDQAPRIYFVNFLKRADWPQRPASTVVETTMVYTHVVKEFRMPARSPLDVIHSGTRPWPPDYDRV